MNYRQTLKVLTTIKYHCNVKWILKEGTDATIISTEIYLGKALRIKGRREIKEALYSTLIDELTAMKPRLEQKKPEWVERDVTRPAIRTIFTKAERNVARVFNIFWIETAAYCRLIKWLQFVAFKSRV